MTNIEYSEAAVEVLDILNHTDKDAVSKIPQSFIKFLTEISNKSYQVNFNHEYPLDGFNLRKQTRELLGFIYITWWCNESERIKYKNLIHEKHIEKVEVNEKYDVNNIFKDKIESQQLVKVQNVRETGTSMAICNKESLFKKVINKILNFFTL